MWLHPGQCVTLYLWHSRAGRLHMPITRPRRQQQLQRGCTHHVLQLPAVHSSQPLPDRLATHRCSTRSHNHRRVGEKPLEVTRSKPLLKQGHLELLAQDHVQVASEYLQGWRLQRLSGQPVPVLGHPHNEKVFLGVQR